MRTLQVPLIWSLALALSGAACISTDDSDDDDDDDQPVVDAAVGDDSPAAEDAPPGQPDAWQPPPDGWQPPPDAWQPPPDAWQPPPDAWTPPPDAAGGCQVPASLGSVGFVDGAVTLDSSANPATYMKWKGQINSDPRPDAVILELFDGYGAFATDIHTGTFALTGDELDYTVCGICVLVHADIDPSTGIPEQYYLATGGTVNLTSVTGTLAGSLSGVSLTHVTLDGWVATPVGDCDTHVTGLSFSDPIP